MFFKISILKKMTSFTRKHALESLFNKVEGLKACNFIKKILEHRSFPVKFAKPLRTPLYRTPPLAASALARNSSNYID